MTRPCEGKLGSLRALGTFLGGGASGPLSEGALIGLPPDTVGVERNFERRRHWESGGGSPAEKEEKCRGR